MTALSNYQFEILPDDGIADGVVFGIGSGAVDMEDGGFIPGDDDWATDDSADDFNGGNRFGRDRLTGPTHGFSLFTNRDTEDEALATLAEFKKAWRALSIRNSPSDLVACRYRLNNRYRRFYGRPRRFSAPPTNMIQGGYIPITTDFAAESGYYYDDTEQMESISMRALTGDSDSGLIFPVTFPATSVPVGSGEAQFVVGGDAPAYPIIRFNGPVSNPKLSCDDWTLSLGISIPAGQYVEVDLRPWKKTVMLNGQSSAAGALSANRRQYLSDMVLQPGRPQFSFWGSTVSGSPTCTVRWRDTYNSY